MDSASKILSDVVAFRTYAKYLPHANRRETFQETVNRCMNMHLDKYPNLSKDIIKAFEKVHGYEIMPAMRSLQFAGEAIKKNNLRSFNCSYCPIDNVRAFGETLFLLLSGCGVGFSVQNHHIKDLPFVKTPKEEGLYIVHDSIEGWAQALDQLVEAYFYKRIRPIYDFNSIRQKGAYLSTTGAKAPGPEPLKHMLNMVEFKLKKAIGRQLKPLEVHDIVCIISDAVIAGGIRRSSLISLFDRNDEEMLKCKTGEWWTASPWRARANNSAVLPRDEVTQEEFDYIFSITQNSGSGEPGFAWTNDKNNFGLNPCSEISLENNNLCNLTTINQTTITSKKDFLSRIYSATLIGTLQASYTDFPYVRDRWRRVCEEKALLGVSFTGIGDREGTAPIPVEWLEEGARYALEINEKYSKKININKASRIGTIKPEGSASLVCATSSGVHARHSPYYLRRVRMPSNDSLALYLKYKIPQLMEEDKFSPNTVILVVPQQSPESSIYREKETALSLLERTVKYNKSWIQNTHREGSNYNNVSVTISVKEDEWAGLKEKMWEYRNCYTGISLLPYDGGTYVQAPFEECDENTYTSLLSSLHEIDLREVREELDMTERMSIQACAGGACEIT